MNVIIYTNKQYIVNLSKIADLPYLSKSCMYILMNSFYVVVPIKQQGNKEQNLVILLVMIPVVLLGGSITIVGVLTREKGTSIGKKTQLIQKLVIERYDISPMNTLFLKNVHRSSLGIFVKCLDSLFFSLHTGLNVLPHNTHWSFHVRYNRLMECY